MAITKSAKKEIKASAKKRVFNDRRKKAMRGSIKSVLRLVKENKKEEANNKLSEVYKAIDKAAKRGVIKPNTASRKKSRINAKIKKLA